MKITFKRSSEYNTDRITQTDPLPEKTKEYLTNLMLGKRTVLCEDGKTYIEGSIITTIDGDYVLMDVGGKPRWIKLDRTKKNNYFNGDTYSSVTRNDVEGTVPGYKFLD